MCALLSFAPGCEKRRECDGPVCAQAAGSTAGTEAGATTWIKDELYFGLSKPAVPASGRGGTISAVEWQRFVDEQITPAFKDGLTVVDAYGQWLNSAGSVAKEPSKLVILIHTPSPEQDAAITKIIDSYKRQFQQESVLWVTSKVKAKF
jgi:hypothetical protein